MTGEGSAHDFVVGVDGGGTGSRAMVMAPGGREVATAQGPPALVDPTDPGAASMAIAETIRSAAEAAGILLPVGALWAGLAGAGRRGAREAVEIALRSMNLAGAVQVGMDVEGAHTDAFGAGPGILMVLGTGSMVWGRDPEGRELRVGGWGGLLGDEGSGYWFGLQGLRAMARASDGRSGATTLGSSLLSALHLSDARELISWIAAASKSEVAALAPLVLEAAEEGDVPAGAILDEGRKELRAHMEVVRRSWEPWPRPIPMALVGGLVEEVASFREEVSALVLEIHGILPGRPVLPVRGAARRALALI